MAGIYIHIPFCKKACHYCDFHFSTSFQKKDEMIRAIVEEIKLQYSYLQGQEIETIYFGGGTPSAVPASDIKLIFEAISQSFSISTDVEITLETNPDDIQKESLDAWKTIGINRLSIGIQAFQEEILKTWNRSHTSDQAIEAIALSQKSGFQNITADLIYSGPGLTDKDWIQNIQLLVDSRIPHISSYALTVEKGTALAYQINTGKVKAPDDDQSNRQYSILQSMLQQHGFEQYEVSNFSKKGWESKHNRSYWSGVHYLGLGPSAHSFNGVSRQWNVANNIKYISSIEEGVVPFEKEMLTEEQRFNEMVMTGLRTSKGIDMERVRLIGQKYVEYLEGIIAKSFKAEKLFKNTIGNWTLNPEYYFFADGIAAELFILPPAFKG